MAPACIISASRCCAATGPTLVGCVLSGPSLHSCVATGPTLGVCVCVCVCVCVQRPQPASFPQCCGHWTNSWGVRVPWPQPVSFPQCWAAFGPTLGGCVFSGPTLHHFRSGGPVATGPTLRGVCPVAPACVISAARSVATRPTLVGVAPAACIISALQCCGATGPTPIGVCVQWPQPASCPRSPRAK